MIGENTVVVGRFPLTKALEELANQALLDGKRNRHAPFLERLLERAQAAGEITAKQLERISAKWVILIDRIEAQAPASHTHGALEDLKTCLTTELGTKIQAA